MAVEEVARMAEVEVLRPIEEKEGNCSRRAQVQSAPPPPELTAEA